MSTFNLSDALRHALPYIVELEVGRYFIFAGLASIILWAFWKSFFAKRKIQTRTATSADLLREVTASVRTALIFAANGLAMYIGAKLNILTIYLDFKTAGLLYLVVSLLFMIVCHDTYFYWTHRLIHHRKLFRRMHLTHHKSHTPTPWTAYAFDWQEAFINAAFVPLFVAIVPMHDLAIYIFMTHQLTRNVMGHAGAEFFPRLLINSRWFGWITSTTHHDLHHQSGRHNFGLYFTWWDRLMGTEHPDYRANFLAVTRRSPTSNSLEEATSA